jgi:hypothetical protein
LSIYEWRLPNENHDRQIASNLRAPDLPQSAVGNRHSAIMSEATKAVFLSYASPAFAKATAGRQEAMHSKGGLR